MAVLIPSTHRRLPDGCYDRHTALAAPGCGVPGGFKQYVDSWPVVNIDLSAYGPTDNISPALAAAYNTYKGLGRRLVIPEGEWTMNGAVVSPSVGGQLYYGGVMFEGSGMNRTVLNKTSGTGSLFDFGSTTSWFPTSPNTSMLVTSGDLAQGATTLQYNTAEDTFNRVAVGRPMRIYWSDNTDPAAIAAGHVPVFHTEGDGAGFVRSQQVIVTGKSSNTLTFYPPVMHRPPPGLTTRICIGSYNAAVNLFGLRNMSLRVADGVSCFTVVSAHDSHSFWFHNVEISCGSATNYGLRISTSTRYDVRGCWLHGKAGAGTNHGVLLLGGCSAGLFEDTIVTSGSPPIEINYCFGNIFHACYVDYINCNHSTGGFGDAFVRCVFGYAKPDGYFGMVEGLSFVGCWAFDLGGGFAMRRFTFNSNIYGCVMGRTTYTSAFDFERGFGIPYLGGVDPLPGSASEIMNGSYPGDWPYPVPSQYVKLLTRQSETVGIWEAQGSLSIVTGFAHRKIQLASPVGWLEGATAIINSKTWQATRLGGGTLPAEGDIFALLAPGADGYSEHNMDVWNTLDMKGSFMLSPNATAFPPQSIGADSIWEPLGYTSAPAGDGVDELSWGSCPWYTNSGQQYGFIDRASPQAVTVRDIPAGRRFTDGTIFDETPPVDPPAPTSRRVRFARAPRYAQLVAE